MPSLSIGKMREALVVQTNVPPTLSVSSLTRSSTTATATTAVAHGFAVGDYVTFAGSTIVGWNTKFKIVTVPSATTLTFTCASTLTTPATGTITVIYTSNASGGQGANFWRTAWTEYAEAIPLGAMERLQIQAVQSSVQYRFRVYTRAGRTAGQRILWTPSTEAGLARKTLVMTGPALPCEDGRRFQYIEAAEVAA